MCSGVVVGFVGGGAASHPRLPLQVDTEGLYKILGVEKTADQNEIRKAFMRLARKVCAVVADVCLAAGEADAAEVFSW